MTLTVTNFFALYSSLCWFFFSCVTSSGDGFLVNYRHITLFIFYMPFLRFFLVLFCDANTSFFVWDNSVSNVSIARFPNPGIAWQVCTNYKLSHALKRASRWAPTELSPCTSRMQPQRSYAGFHPNISAAWITMASGHTEFYHGRFSFFAPLYIVRHLSKATSWLCLLVSRISFSWLLYESRCTFTHNITFFWAHARVIDIGLTETYQGLS